MYGLGKCPSDSACGGGQGIWPAFWMLPSEGSDNTSGEGVYGHWPMSGEIDIMEAINHMDTSSAALHFGGPGQHHRQITASTIDHLKADKVWTWCSSHKAVERMSIMYWQI